MSSRISILPEAMILFVACCAAASVHARANPDVPPAQFVDSARRQKLLQALPRIEGMLSERMREQHIPGLGYAIVIDGELVVAAGLGLRDVAAGAPVTADTVFRIASMTKSFTALAILGLRDAGKLRLDDPASRYVPEMRAWQAPTADSDQITIRHLLAHVAGFPEDDPQGDYTLDTTPAAFSEWLSRGVAFSTATGDAFEYSNLGFMILGEIVTNVAGRPFQEYITDQILMPLGMRSTWWSPAAVPAARLATGYSRQKDAWVEQPPLPDGTGAAMGGMLTSPPDLARYVAMMLSAYPPRDDPEQAPAPRHTLREMQAGLGFPEVWLARAQPGSPLAARAISYGFGLNAIRDCGWGREVEHSGGLPGFGSNMRWLPDHGVGVIVLTNLTYASTGPLAREALLLLQETGALQPRQPMPSRQLMEMAQAATELVLDSNDKRVRAFAADNLFRNEPLEDRKASIARLRGGLRDCRRGEMRAESALRGTFRIDCTGGRLDVSLTLTPERPARIQSLDVSAAHTASDALARAAEAVTGAIASGVQGVPVVPGFDRAGLAAALEATRYAFGTCRLGELVESDGSTTAKYSLVCDRGRLDMSLSLEEGQLAAAMLVPSTRASCVP